MQCLYAAALWLCLLLTFVIWMDEEGGWIDEEDGTWCPTPLYWLLTKATFSSPGTFVGNQTTFSTCVVFGPSAGVTFADSHVLFDGSCGTTFNETTMTLDNSTLLWRTTSAFTVCPCLPQGRSDFQISRVRLGWAA